MRRILCFRQMVDFIGDLLLEVLFMLVQLQAFVSLYFNCMCMYVRFCSCLLFATQFLSAQLSMVAHAFWCHRF